MLVVGYIVYVTQITISNSPKLGEKISLFTELIVKEDLLQLVDLFHQLSGNGTNF